MHVEPKTREREAIALSATPRLEGLLARLSRSLRLHIWMHGVGSLLLAVSAWLAFAFVADWALHVPVGVRWIHLAILLGLPLLLVWRELARHLRRVPGKAELAVLVERQHPDLRELLVSAVQFQQTRETPGAPELVQRVLRDADVRAGALQLDGVLAPRPPRVRIGLGLAAAAILLVLANAQPALTSIFFARLFGASTAWPRRTELAVSIPSEADRAHVTETSDGLEVRVARGTDVPVLVQALGEVPDEVTLQFKSGEKLVLGASSDGSFRTLLRGTQSDVEFTATGGDDRDEYPRVRIVVLQPPDVAGLRVTVRAPEYTGLPERVEVDRDVEVLAGSSVRVAMLPAPESARGIVRLLPEDRTLELVPTPYPANESGPADESAPPNEPGAAPRPGLGFEVLATESLRYRFELTDDTGLSNPDPGLFGIRVVDDQRPEVELLAPLRAEVETVAGGALRLRARATDDFGIVVLGWRARDLAQDGAAGELTPFELQTPQMELSGDDAKTRARVVGGTRLDVASLLPPSASDAPAVESGTLFEIQVQAHDNRPALAGGPDPAGVGNATAVRVRVLGPEEFLRRLQDRLARLRVQTAELDELQRQKTHRAQELLAALESDQPQLDTRTNPILPVLTGQRRVQGDAEALARELTSVLESVLYARIDDSSGALLEELDQHLSNASAKGFQLEAWRASIASWRSGAAVSTGLAPQLVGIVELALTISADDAPATCAKLVEAADAKVLENLHAQLTLAIERQVVLQEHVAELLDRLAEWDNFQSILSLARDILSRQKAVRERTKEIIQGK